MFGETHLLATVVVTRLHGLRLSICLDPSTNSSILTGFILISDDMSPTLKFMMYPFSVRRMMPAGGRLLGTHKSYRLMVGRFQSSSKLAIIKLLPCPPEKVTA
ncbi:uncharacterized protein F4807DRAFT_429076 [Annulohypoxylon truncatum]|uniref:uncharacterized protein n=1 Tax=Annulohypoxylon truncatum TaxID=327061 RepID=UPI0020085CB7|nr:uncharacterized protein F4807DRAFT_429076 [Annulohypoxylon truncatum]KAI1208715.1 hypothetical protein F4807DRAFT_429076 [Annulohypoxylon truncatum]